jgi:Putative Flp pilus-assembly TadE/G-like
MLMTSRAAGRPEADGGAVAILTAMLALVLFGFAAVAVELGDLYSRDAAVQTTADLAAFAGAQELPNACQAFNKAREYLTDDKNGVFSDTAPTTFSATVAQLSDGDDTNGEIEILDWDNKPLPDPTSAPCNNRVGHRVRVTTPRRTINFPLAGGLPGAPDSGTVQATAGVEVRSLDHLSVLPFSLPDSCGLGSQTIYDLSGVSPPPSGTIDYQPNGARQGPYVTAVDPDSVQMPVFVTTINVSLSRLRADPDPPTDPPPAPPPPPAPAVQFDFHLLQADGTTLREPPTGGVDGILESSTGPVAGRFNAVFTVALPATVATTPGDWKIRARQAAPGSNRYTRDSRVGSFTVLPPVLTSCIPSADPSGLFTSPRAGGGSSETQLANNLRLGIDHDLFPVVNTTPDTPCDADGAPYSDARLDDTSPTDGATCVDVHTSTVATPTDGLIGSGAQGGRLVGTPTVTTSGNCRVNGPDDDNLKWTKNSRVLVDTVLSCYLSSTRSLADVKSGLAGSLTQSILNDPRFFVMPRTDTSFDPSNSSGPSGGPQYWPINDLVGAFVTNETVAGGDATCASSDDCNGLIFNGSNLTKVQAFTFPLSALSAASDPANGRAYIGGPKDTLLVE